MASSAGVVRVFMHKEIIPGFGVLKEKLPIFIGQSHMKPVHIYIVILGAGGLFIKKTDVLQRLSLLVKYGNGNTVFRGSVFCNRIDLNHMGNLLSTSQFSYSTVCVNRSHVCSIAVANTATVSIILQKEHISSHCLRVKNDFSIGIGFTQ